MLSLAGHDWHASLQCISGEVNPSSVQPFRVLARMVKHAYVLSSTMQVVQYSAYVARQGLTHPQDWSAMLLAKR